MRPTTTALCLTAVMLLVGGVSAEEVLDAGDFGLHALKPGEDATPVLRRAIEECKRRGADGLRVPPGEWTLYPDYAFERRMAVANNDRGIKRVVFLLEGLDGFRLEADGARLVCHGEMIPISVEDSRDVHLRGFSIDWATPFYFQASVVATHPEQNAFDLRVRDEVHYEVRGDRLVFRGKPSEGPEMWKEWAPLPTERTTWEHNLQWNVWFDGGTRHPLPAEHLWKIEPDPTVEPLAPGLVRVYDALPSLPEVGWVLVVKGMGSPNRTSPAIRLARTDAAVLEDVTIHHAGGMGLIAQRCDGVRVSRMRVVLPDGAGRFVTTSADATHFNGCRGQIVIEDSVFENMLDDATNVHGCFVRVDARPSPSTIVCRLVHSQQRGLVFAELGDRLRFVRSDSLQPCGEATVAGVRVLNDDLIEIRLEQTPDFEIPTTSGAYNLSWQPSLEFRRCLVRNNRGRSMLVATSGDVLIERNVFERSTLAGIQFEGDNVFWWESGPTRSVRIRDNQFRDVMGHVLRVVPHIDASRHPHALYHGGIRFHQNRISTYHRRIVHGRAVDGLSFTANRITTSRYLSEPLGPDPAIHFESGRGFVMTGNRYDQSPPLSIRIDATIDTPVISDNESIEATGVSN